MKMRMKMNAMPPPTPEGGSSLRDSRVYSGFLKSKMIDSKDFIIDKPCHSLN